MHIEPFFRILVVFNVSHSVDVEDFGEDVEQVYEIFCIFVCSYNLFLRAANLFFAVYLTVE